jgi:hypothetical protein
MRLLSGFAAVGVLLSAGLWMTTGSAHAQAGAFCAVQGGTGGYENCGYPTFAACQAAVSAVGGHCMRNPRAVVVPDGRGEDGYEEPRRRRAPRY